ncbi:MAG: aminopeptidase P N-terminal domain-containing protein [Candidatus Marinimicrobia bacterium]|nr:aminopeptidase P N-terminal domain-containing protein [Candidatus Neomarinimicrobiota bacterium]
MLLKIKLILPLILILLSGTTTNGMSKKDGLPRDEFARRRAIFLDELRELNACAIFHTAPQYDRNHHVEHPYRQDSDFFYLTGWPLKEGILVLTPQENPGDSAEVSLFVTPRKPKMEVWTGPKAGIDEAKVLPGIDQAYDYEEFYTQLGEMIKGYERLVISYGSDPVFEHEFVEHLESTASRPSLVQEASALLKSHRLIKSDHEIQSLEKAIDVTNQALADAWPVIPTMKFEYEVQAFIEYGMAKRGAERLGFPSIIGAGKNSTYLHYEGNHGDLIVGDLLLIDVGAEWNYYSADISRTVPISGTYSPEQKAIYQLVLDAQLAAIDRVMPGVSWREPHDTVVAFLTSGLVDLGLLEGDPATLIQEKAYRKYFMHGSSHWLGLDVHDVGGWVGDNGAAHQLKVGMVLTVEPGIYIGESEDVDPKWWNIGVRIEDDVLVTQKGHRVLSQSIPKTIQEIEALMQP